MVFTHDERFKAYIRQKYGDNLINVYASVCGIFLTFFVLVVLYVMNYLEVNKKTEVITKDVVINDLNRS